MKIKIHKKLIKCISFVGFNRITNILGNLSKSQLKIISYVKQYTYARAVVSANQRH